jgi:ribosomal protein S12 methylthiotransferase accessory factor YcaO
MAQRGFRVFPVSDYIGHIRFPGLWPFTPYDDDRELTWVEGEALTDRQPVWIPASFVRLTARGEPGALVEGSSTGTAAGANADEATVAALLELIERDAVMAAWTDGLPLERSSSFDRDAEWVGPPTWVTHWLAARSRFGPTVAVVLTLDKRRQIYGIGASAALDVDRRRSHALAEAIMTRFGVVLGGRRIESRLRIEDHRAYYCNEPRLTQMERRLVGPVAKHPESSVSLPDVLASLEREGVVAVRVILRSDGSGRSVVRVLTTRLYSMEADVACARLPMGAPVPADYHIHPYG